MDRLFTGQRLDKGTGLYYYGARYYDSEIGRFISADSTIPDGKNPQSFNRYSYCINNPTSAFDPSGKDYIFVGGAFSKQSDTWWIDMLIALDWDPTKDRVLFIPDKFENDPLEVASRGTVFEVQDQEAALEDALLNGEYTDIKIIGHSEGAAATANTLNKFTDTSSYLYKSGIGSELRGAALLDMPTGICEQVSGWNDNVMNGLPDRLAGVDISMGLADIHGTFIHASEFTGWSGLSYQIYDFYYCDPWRYDPYGYSYPYINPDYICGHSSMRLEPETINIIQNTMGSN